MKKRMPRKARVESSLLDAPSIYTFETSFADREAVLGLPLETADFSQTREKREEVSWIYFIQQHQGLLKIGFSISPLERLKSLQTANPYPLKVFAIVQGTMREEKALHARLASFRLEGEWFQDHPKVWETVSLFCQYRKRFEARNANLSF